jgi:excisionase family DNA binding protein
MDAPVKGKPRLMTSEEAAKYLRISKASLYRLAKNGEIPVSKVGRQYRFRKDIVDEWLSKKEAANTNRKDNKNARPS